MSLISANTNILVEGDSLARPKIQDPANNAVLTSEGIATRGSRSVKIIKSLPFLGSYHYQRTTIATQWPAGTGDSNAQDKNDIVIEHKIIPATWLHLLGFSIQNLYRRGITQYSLRPLRVIPYDHPIFEACLSGSILGIIALLKDGSASLNDVTPDGMTLLHVISTSS
jgi:hypothetical protein